MFEWAQTKWKLVLKGSIERHMDGSVAVSGNIHKQLFCLLLVAEGGFFRRTNTTLKKHLIYS